jgi:hypothetical protein
MTLTPVVSSNVTPPNVAWQNSWINIKNDQNRPLFAGAVYDIANAQALGQNGFVITDGNDTTQYNGTFTTIQVLTATKFAGVTASNCFIGNALTTIELPSGFTFNGPITNFKLQYGAVIAYKA